MIGTIAAIVGLSEKDFRFLLLFFVGYLLSAIYFDRVHFTRTLEERRLAICIFGILTMATMYDPVSIFVNFLCVIAGYFVIKAKVHPNFVLVLVVAMVSLG